MLLLSDTKLHVASGTLNCMITRYRITFGAVQCRMRESMWRSYRHRWFRLISC